MHLSLCVALFRSGGEKRLFSEAILCLMGLFENPLSKKTPDGGKYTGSEGRVQALLRGNFFGAGTPYSIPAMSGESYSLPKFLFESGLMNGCKAYPKILDAPTGSPHYTAFQKSFRLSRGTNAQSPASR